MSDVVVSSAAPKRLPRYCFTWNGEISDPPCAANIVARAADANSPAPAAVGVGGAVVQPAAAIPLSHPCMVYSGTFVCDTVSVKRVREDAVDGAAIDHLLELVGVTEQPQADPEHQQHILTALTCQRGRPGDPPGAPYYYFVMEACEHNLADFVARAKTFPSTQARCGCGAVRQGVVLRRIQHTFADHFTHP